MKKSSPQCLLSISKRKRNVPQLLYLPPPPPPHPPPPPPPCRSYGQNLRSTNACMYMYKPTFCLNSAIANIQTREIDIVGNGQILQWNVNVRNQHFAELRQKVCLYIHAFIVLPRCLQSLDVKHELFITKKEEETVNQALIRQTIRFEQVGYWVTNWSWYIVGPSNPDTIWHVYIDSFVYRHGSFFSDTVYWISFTLSKLSPNLAKAVLWRQKSDNHRGVTLWGWFPANIVAGLHI